MEVLYTETQGQGNTLVLLHGFCEDSTVWQWVLPALQKQYAVVTVDLPGFGKSSLTPDKEIETIEDIASRLAYTLTQLGIEKCTLVGHSMGGYVTLAFAERHPERLNGWGLFHSTAYEDSAEKKENRLKQVEFVTKNGTVPFVEVLVPSLFSTQTDCSVEIEISLAMAKKCSAKGIINALLAMHQRNQRLDVLKNTEVPVLIIAGNNDTIVPVDTLSYQASLPQQCKFVLFTESAHMGMLEEPKKSIEVLEQFMQWLHPTV